jgi:hypothetical protein
MILLEIVVDAWRKAAREELEIKTPVRCIVILPRLARERRKQLHIIDNIDGREHTNEVANTHHDATTVKSKRQRRDGAIYKE